MRFGTKRWTSAVLLLALGLGLSGCVYAGPGYGYYDTGYYAGPAYYPSYYGPPAYGSVYIGGGWGGGWRGGWGHHHWR
jgi:hypothetical protein